MTPAEIVAGALGLWAGLAIGFIWGWTRGAATWRRRQHDLLASALGRRAS